MNLMRGRHALASLYTLATSVGAMDVGLMTEVTNNGNEKGKANLYELYENAWEQHYEQHNIIKTLDLNEDEYAESIKNIESLGLSSIENYIKKQMLNIHPFYMDGKEDLLIVTNMSENESIIEYLMRQEVEHFNYILLENLMPWLLLAESQCSTNDLLEFLVTKIEKRLEKVKNTNVFEEIMAKVKKSVNDVKAYVDAGALDEFMVSWVDSLKNGKVVADDCLDDEHEEDLKKLPNSFEQDKSSINPLEEEDNRTDIDTKEGKEIATNLVTNMCDLAKIYDRATIIAVDTKAGKRNKAGNVVKQYIVELNTEGKLAKIYELDAANELIKIDKSNEIYESIKDQEQFLQFSAKDEKELLQIARKTKRALNEFDRRIKGGTTCRELMRIMGLVFLGEEFDLDQDKDRESEESKTIPFDTKSDKKIIEANLDISTIWNLLVRFEGEITDDWLDVNVKAALMNLTPYLEQYIKDEKKTNKSSQIYVKKHVSCVFPQK